MEEYGRIVLEQNDGQEQEFKLTNKNVSIGRFPTNDIVLDDIKVSRDHASIEFVGSKCVIRDLDSTNGIQVNDKLVKEIEIRDGDRIQIGLFKMRYDAQARQDKTEILCYDSLADLDTVLADSPLTKTLYDNRIPHLVVQAPDKTWKVDLTTDDFNIGRSKENDLAFDTAEFSRQHARIEVRGDQVYINDLDSLNGTWMGGKRVDHRLLENGDMIRIGKIKLIYKAGFEPGQQSMEDLDISPQKLNRYPVIIVPGMMGSELYDGDDLIWPGLKYILKNPEAMKLPHGDHLQAKRIMGEVVVIPNMIKMDRYSLLGDYLVEGLGYERGKDLIEFYYDFRKDNRLAAKQLAEVVENWDAPKPYVIIAHSMGGLVSRYFINCLGGKSKIKKIMFLGTPHQGVPIAITQVLMPIKQLLPFGLMGEKLREVVSSFPSIYQLMPTYQYLFNQDGQAIDVLNDASWCSEEQLPLFKDSRAFWKELGNRCAVEAISVFGYDRDTITKINIRQDEDSSWHNLQIETNPEGDNRVPVTSAVLEKSEVHPVHQDHGVLFVDPDVQMRMKMELINLPGR